MRLGRKLDHGQRWLRFRLRASRLNPWRVPLLRPSSFKGKRVIIVGPAATALEDLEATNVDGFDVIVRLNNGIALALGHSGLGSRTDVLFHNLVENGERSAGVISAELLRSHGVHTCVFPHWGFKGSKARLYKKLRVFSNEPDLRIVVPPVAFCEDVRRELGGLQPTVGASAILFFLTCDLRELAIHGFTFFETPYLAGYNDAVTTDRTARAWAEATGVHAPAREKELIARRVSAAVERGLSVALGKNVRQRLQLHPT